MTYARMVPSGTLTMADEATLSNQTDDAAAVEVEAVVRALGHVGREALDDGVDEALAAVGRAYGVDRAYVFSYDFAAGLCHNTHEWCAPTIEPQIAILQAFPLHLVHAWVVRHRAGEMMDVDDVLALPPDSGVRQTLEPQGIKSLVSVPLMVGPTCLGFVGIDAVRRQRSFGAEERAVLHALAEALASAYVRLGLVPIGDRVAGSAPHDAVR